MRLKDRPLLGIELHEGELRLAVVSEKGSSVVVEAASHVKLPHSALRHGTVIEPGAVAVALKRLLESNGLGSIKDAVIGIPAGGAVVRNLQIPPVPDPELPQIVAGEVEHYGIVTATGAHAFLKLYAPSKSPNEFMSVVVAGAENNLIASISEVAERAELNIIALEPVEFAMCRTALASLGQDPTAFVLAISESSTTLMFVREGKLWAYRQLDTGAGSLTHKVRGHTGEGIDLVIDRAATLAFAKEVRRTIEYLSRSYAEDGRIDSVQLTTNELPMAGLPELLSEMLGRPVTLHLPGQASGGATTLQKELMQPEAVRYTAAIGLALRANRWAAAVAPPVDLYASERLATKAGEQKRMLGLTFGAGALALVLGAGGMLMYQRQISEAESQIVTLKEQAAGIQRTTSEALRTKAAELEQYRLLRAAGAPVVPLMDYLTGGMPPETGLTSVLVDPSKVVRVSGESLTEEGVMGTWRVLQGVPVVTDARLDDMRKAPDKDGLTFTVVGALVGTDKVKLRRGRMTP